MSKETIREIIQKLRVIKDQQLDLAQKEHKLHSELMQQIDTEFMNGLKDKVRGQQE